MCVLWRRLQARLAVSFVVPNYGRDVRYRHKADMGWCTAHVRYWGQSGHDGLHRTCPLLTQSGHCIVHRSGLASRFPGDACLRAEAAVSIRSVYTYYGTHRQEVTIPPQHGRIKAGRATAVQKQSVLALKLFPEELRELAKRNF